MKRISKTRNRRWTEDELELLALVLTDEENNFASSLETLTLKKSANNEVFESLKKIFDEKLKELSFAEKNARNFTLKDGVARNYELLDTSIEKLRKNYTIMKTEWRKLTDRIKRGGDWSTINEPKWCKILNEIFAEAHENLAASARAEDLLFFLNEESDLSTSSSEENEENHIKSPQVNGEETQRKKTSCSTTQKEKIGEVADTRNESAS